MKTIFALAGLIILSGCTSTQISQQKLPLFGAFISFCVNTDGEPSTVAKAIAAVGGKALNANSASSTFSSGNWGWNVVVDGQELAIFVWKDGLQGARTPTDEESCEIVESGSSDVKSLQAIQAWVGVPAFEFSKNLTTYSYVEIAGKRRLYDWKIAETQGSSHINVLHDGRTEIELVRFIRTGAR